MEGTVLDGAVRLGPARETDAGALFTAESLPGSGFPAGILVRFIPERMPGEPLLERHLEAIYLTHPHLLRCYGAGTAQTPFGPAVYVVLEHYDATLAQDLRERALEEREIRSLGTDLVPALEYLHERGLVCCGLEPRAVVRVGDSWKIGDYSQVRLAGSGYSGETRRLLATSPAVPPEAFEGVVTPAWDSWSLAAVLIAAVSGPKPERSEGAGRRNFSRRELPAPIAAVVAECMAADPSQRCGIRQIASALEAEGVSERPPSEEPAVPVQVPVQPSATPPPRPLETRFRTEEVPRWNWVHMAVAGLGAVVLGAVVAAITLNHKSSETPAMTPPVQAAAKPSPSDPPPEAQPPGTGTAERASPGDARQEIQNMLDRWIAAGRARDASAQASFYAPKVDAFYGARSVSRDWIRRNREKTFSSVGAVRQLQLSDVQVKMNGPDRATVTFDKSWDFDRAFAGKVRQQLGVRRTNGTWWIVSERDVRVYRVRSGRTRHSA